LWGQPGNWNDEEKKRLRMGRVLTGKQPVVNPVNLNGRQTVTLEKDIRKAIVVKNMGELGQDTLGRRLRPANRQGWMGKKENGPSKDPRQHRGEKGNAAKRRGGKTKA